VERLGGKGEKSFLREGLALEKRGSLASKKKGLKQQILGESTTVGEGGLGPRPPRR